MSSSIGQAVLTKALFKKLENCKNSVREGDVLGSGQFQETCPNVCCLSNMGVRQSLAEQAKNAVYLKGIPNFRATLIRYVLLLDLNIVSALK